MILAEWTASVSSLSLGMCVMRRRRRNKRETRHPRVMISDRILALSLFNLFTSKQG